MHIKVGSAKLRKKIYIIIIMIGIRRNKDKDCSRARAIITYPTPYRLPQLFNRYGNSATKVTHHLYAKAYFPWKPIGILENGQKILHDMIQL